MHEKEPLLFILRMHDSAFIWRRLIIEPTGEMGGAKSIKQIMEGQLDHRAFLFVIIFCLIAYISNMGTEKYMTGKEHPWQEKKKS